MAVPCLVLFCTALGYGALGTYTAQEAIRQKFPPVLGFLPTQAAFLSCMAIGMVGMRIAMTRLGFGKRPIRLLPGMVLTAALALALLAILPGGAPRHALSALLYGGGYSMIHTLVNAHALEVASPDRRGAAFGSLLFSFDSGIGIGSFLIGSVIGLGCARWGDQGYRAGWALAALFAFAALPLSRRMARGA
jgi:predicted MFS family arabinose efflux permease